MRKIAIALALAGFAAMPSLATQQDEARQGGARVPHTVHGELLLFRDTNYNGEQEVVEDPNSRVSTDWPIRSLAVHPGDRWQICGRPRFRDPCIILDRSVHDATLIGVDDQIGSARLARAEDAESD
jgi:hypothetical protein